MTVPNITERNPYVGNGVASSFAFNFPIQNNNQLRVLQMDTNFNVTVLTLGASNNGFTVQAGSANNPNGGNITYIQGGITTPLPAGFSLLIRRVMADTQTTDLKNTGSYYPETVENALDTLCMVSQTLQAVLGQCIQAPEMEGLAAAGYKIPSIAQRALQILSFDVNGNATVTAPGLAFPFYTQYAFSALPAQTSFAMALCTDGPFAIYNPVLGSWQAIDQVGP